MRKTAENILQLFAANRCLRESLAITSADEKDTCLLFSSPVVFSGIFLRLHTEYKSPIKDKHKEKKNGKLEDSHPLLCSFLNKCLCVSA